MEVDHKVPRSRGGADLPHNRQLLHGHCHDVKTPEIDLGPMTPKQDTEAVLAAVESSSAQRGHSGNHYF